jgi:hypothetical protein
MREGNNQVCRLCFQTFGVDGWEGHSESISVAGTEFQAFILLLLKGQVSNTSSLPPFCPYPPAHLYPLELDEQVLAC